MQAPNGSFFFQAEGLVPGSVPVSVNGWKGSAWFADDLTGEGRNSGCQKLVQEVESGRETL